MRGGTVFRDTPIWVGKVLFPPEIFESGIRAWHWHLGGSRGMEFYLLCVCVWFGFHMMAFEKKGIASLAGVGSVGI